MPDRNDSALFTTAQVRFAFAASAIGMVGLLVLLLVLATSRPQGALRPAADQQHRDTVTAAAEKLDGYEVVGDTRARIDIDHAIDLVAERGVDLELTHVGTELDGAAADAEEGEDGPAADASEADGAAVYAANCAACHQASGAGVPGAFPPLANGHAPEVLAADGGRAYLIRAVVFGVQGSIEVQGQTYAGLMPSWQQLSDAEIAAVLNHVLTDWGNEAELPGEFEPIRADEVAAAAEEGLAPTEVLELRPELD
ncbi:MAG: cytochrome c [Trueperaceae bacterium]|nr:cytochrome c [Trueperaceae bacterium]